MRVFVGDGVREQEGEILGIRGLIKGGEKVVKRW